MSNETESKPTRSRTLIAFATCWGSKFGGINSFNSDLLSALGIAFYRDIRVVCVVLDADTKDIQKAANDHVEVISLSRLNDHEFSEEFFSNIQDKLKAAMCVPDSETVWLGHDRITGGIAVKAAKETGGRSALIHHMSYAHYEAYAVGSRTAAEKKTKQRDLFLQSDIILAVGPVLRDALEDLTERKATMLVPGLPEITASEAPKTFTAFLSGRISSDTHRIKQAQLGIAAFANATALSNSSVTLPAALNSKNNPCLQVRGLNEEGKSSPDGTDPEIELKQFAERYANRVINLNALPFTTDRAEIFNELRRASVALMPSWHEGFGLVGWEAIAAGVPLVLSENSGVYHLLDELDNGVNKSLVYPIDVRGQVEEPFFHDKDLDKVSEAIIEIAKDPKMARSKAAQLRETLLQKGYTWSSCAKQFIQALGWQALDSQTCLTTAVSVGFPAIKIADSNDVSVDDLLDIPIPQWMIGRGLSDSQLLRAEEAVIPFDGEALPFLNNQIEWAEDDEFPIALRLLVGQAGAGKTRLALQMCSMLRAKGWWAGFLRHGKNNISQVDAIIGKLKNTSHHSLIVIDYAETRKEELLSLIKPLMGLTGSTVLRVLLLARSGGEWWERLERADPRCEVFFAGRASSGPFVVPALYDSRFSRDSAFQRALEIFAKKLDRFKPDNTPDLNADHYSHPLMIQMAALLALHDEQSKTAEGLTRSLVNHERRYWSGLLGTGVTGENHAAYVMALSTLFGGLQSTKEAELIWRQAQCGNNLELKNTFTSLKNLYPESGGLQSLRPDLMGESLVAQVLLSECGKNILDAVLQYSDGKIRLHAWTVLARILRHRADMIPVVEMALVKRYAKNAKDAVEVCCQTPGALQRVMENAFEKLPESQRLQVFQQLSPLIEEDKLPLNDLALLLSETHLQQIRKKTKDGSTGDISKFVEALSHSSVHLQRCGNYQAALKRAEEAEEGYRKLSLRNPDKFQFAWATQLNNYSNVLNENGQDKAGLIAAEKAAEICEQLAAKNPGKYDDDLAMVFNTFANRLGDVGRCEEAVGISKRSIDLYESLVLKSKEKFEGRLAIALNNYAKFLSEIGKSDEALKIIARALDINKRIAIEKPERFEHVFASSLNNYAQCLHENGRNDEALVVAKKAVEIFERLAKAKPARFEHVLASALANLGNRLSDDGELIDALNSNKRALEIHRRLAKELPQRFEVYLVGALQSYSNRLNEDGDCDIALARAREAVEIAERLVESNPVRFEPNLAFSLSTYSSRLGEMGHCEDALQFSQRSLDMLMRLAENKVGRFDADLASFFSNHAYRLSDLGFFEDAFSALKSANKILATCVERIPAVFGPRYRIGLLNEAFICWIVSSDSTPQVALEAVGDSQGNRSGKVWDSVLFYENCIRACLSESRETRCSFAVIAMEKWSTLTSPAKKRFEYIYLLVGLVAECCASRNGGKIDNTEWKQVFDDVSLRRQNRLPRWLENAAAKLGLTFSRATGG